MMKQLDILYSTIKTQILFQNVIPTHSNMADHITEFRNQKKIHPMAHIWVSTQ